MPLTFRFVRPLGNARLRHPEWCFSIAGSQFHSVSCHWIHVVDNLPFSQLSVMRCCDRYVLTRLSDALGVCLCACGFHLCLNPLFLLLQPVILCPVVSKPTLQRARRVFFFLPLWLEHGEIGFDPCEFPLALILACIFLKLFFLRERESRACTLFAVSLAVRALMLLQALLIMPFKWKRRGGEGGGKNTFRG